jgi:hypothetical protein
MRELKQMQPLEQMQAKIQMREQPLEQRSPAESQTSSCTLRHETGCCPVFPVQK